MKRLRRSFFQRYTPKVAKELLGCRLVRVVDGRRLSGIIVETEAYRGRRDPASHAFQGKTARNAVMFCEAGHAYVHFTMGMHYCLNVTTEAPEVPGAVLLRALEPIEGVREMTRNRGLKESTQVADGPGKLAKALGIDMSLNGEDLARSETLFLESGMKPPKIGRSSRVGISRGTEREWRFYIRGSAFVSRGRPSHDRSQNP
jgi:DNA-3-methyladenine glycosylase